MCSEDLKYVLFFITSDEKFEFAKMNRKSTRCEYNDYLDAATLMRSSDCSEIELVAERLNHVPELGAFTWKYLFKVKNNLERIEEAGPNTQKWLAYL